MKKGKNNEIGSWATLARIVLFAGLANVFGLNVFGLLVATVCVLLTYAPEMLKNKK